MDIKYLTITAILISIFFAIALLVIIGKVNKRNTVVKLKKSEIEWKKLKCPKCQKVMDTGFSLPGRGIIWREKNEKKPGPFSNVGSVLENTVSLSFLQPLNISWRCSSCKLVTLDISKMVKVNDA